MHPDRADSAGHGPADAEVLLKCGGIMLRAGDSCGRFYIENRGRVRYVKIPLILNLS